MAGNAAQQQQIVQKVDLLKPKTDPHDLLARVAELERQMAEVQRRG